MVDDRNGHELYGAAAVFELAATGAGIPDELLNAEIELFEQFCESQLPRNAEKFGIDPKTITTHARARIRELRAAIADAKRARRDVLAERRDDDRDRVALRRD